jgi:hypothetical protein
MYKEQYSGIEKFELDPRKAAGECQCCAWPQDTKEVHNTLDCFGWLRKDKGTAPFPKATTYQISKSDLGI